MSSVLIDNQKLSGGILVNSGNNTNAWYTRISYDEFKVNGSFNPLQGIYDWVLTKTTDTHYVKSDIIRFKSPRQSIQVTFKSIFQDENYYVFFTSNANVNLFWSNKKRTGFTISASSPFESEVTWIAIHKTFAKLTGVNNPGTIYAGSRSLVYDTIDCNDLVPNCGDNDACVEDQLDITKDCHANLQGWYENEYIIKPTAYSDGPNIEMNFNDGLFSVLTSTNININTYWLEKANDRAKIGTSFPAKCIIDYLFIKNGYDWWEELP
jgi:hypothetical protein